MADDAHTEDGFLDGRLRVRQFRTGYRAGADAILLAAAVEPEPGARVLEPGCGAGAAMLALASRRADISALGVEIDPPTAELAAGNIAANGFSPRLSVVCADIFEAQVGAFDAILVNPPYAAPGDGKPPADPRRRRAFVDGDGLDRWIRVLADRLGGGGVLTLIHRADALARILAALDGRLGGVEIAPVFPRAGEAAHRVLVRAKKGARSPLRLHRGLVLHAGPEGRFSDAAEAIFRGRAIFDWR